MSLYDKSMGKEARASMEFAEDARDTEWLHPSYSALLYQGKVKWDLLHPFPQQSVEDKKIGDEFIAKELWLEALASGNIPRITKEMIVNRAVFPSMNGKKVFRCSPLACKRIGLSDSRSPEFSQ